MRLRIGGKVAHGLRGDTTRLSWGRRDRWQSFNRLDEGLNCAMDEPRTALLGPGDPRWGTAPIDRLRHLPHVLLSMPEIHDLHRARKVFLDQPPDPEGPIPEDHNLLGPLQSLL